MKILIFSTAYLPFIGGAELAIKEITDRLPSGEFSYDLFTLNLNRREKKKETLGNVRVFRLSCPKFFFPFLALIRARAIHRREPYNCVWSVMASYGGFAGMFFKLLFPDVPFILTLQEGDSLAHIYRRAAFVWPLFRLIFTRADRITAISTYLAAWAKRMGARCPVAVVPNGVDLKRFKIRDLSFKKEEFKRKLGFRAEDRIIVTVSRLSPKNGVRDLISALSFLPEDVKLLVCGSGALRKNLQRTTDNLQLSERVKFSGEVTHRDLPPYLWASDIFCRPSLSEGMGSAFIEAMAAGVPVVATPVGGIPDFLFAPHPGSPEERQLFANSRELANRWEEKVTGLFCSVGDPKDIAAKIQFLLENKELREQIVTNALRMVEERYDWDGIAEKMKEVFVDKLEQ